MTRKNYLTKVAIAFSLSLVFTFLLMKSALASSAKNDPYRVESFTVDAATTLDVETSGGYITVEGSSSNTVRVEMYVRRNGEELNPSDVNLEGWDIDIRQTGNNVKAIAEPKGSSWSFWDNEDEISISFVVYTPRKVDTDLNTSGGHIEIKNLIGNQDLSTSGGHLKLTQLEGSVKARTSGGHIGINKVHGELEARTSGGHINARNAEGDLNVRTSGGHIELEDVSGTIKARTSGGHITADLKSIGRFIELKTSGGSINISVPNGIGLDLDLKGSYVDTHLNNFSGEVERDEVEGKINGGGPKVSARTSGGTVSLSFQE